MLSFSVLHAFYFSWGWRVACEAGEVGESNETHARRVRLEQEQPLVCMGEGGTDIHGLLEGLEAGSSLKTTARKVCLQVRQGLEMSTIVCSQTETKPNTSIPEIRKL